jgi:hypothetical protein
MIVRSTTSVFDRDSREIVNMSGRVDTGPLL